MSRIDRRGYSTVSIIRSNTILNAHISRLQCLFPCIRRTVGQVVAQLFVGASVCRVIWSSLWVRQCEGLDARIKKRLVEIKALPYRRPARLQATRMTNPLLTMCCPLWSQATQSLATTLSTGWGGSIAVPLLYPWAAPTEPSGWSTNTAAQPPRFDAFNDHPIMFKVSRWWSMSTML